jgi:RimJ/RimL family protein N-acetyltransferase
MQSVHLRPATEDDLALTFEITKDAMREYVVQTWGAWNEDEQLEKHQTNFIPSTHRIIVVGGSAAGLVAVEDLPTHIWLVKLYLLSTFRAQGIGSEVLRRVVVHAESVHKSVRLRVLRVNTRAQALYARNGFRLIDQTPERIFMERSASAA